MSATATKQIESASSFDISREAVGVPSSRPRQSESGTGVNIQHVSTGRLPSRASRLRPFGIAEPRGLPEFDVADSGSTTSELAR